ncbi:MAG: hypothetical protein K2P06_03645 [Muribaculaceae bacterium]|nr:hypothetical protein [Muribaculaceae bacterium]
MNIYANKRTIIKGEAKNLLNQTPFEVSVNDIWEANVIVPLSQTKKTLNLIEIHHFRPTFNLGS